MKGEDVVVTPGSNGVFNITLLMDGHGGQSIMKRAVELQKDFLEACGARKDWPGCAAVALGHFQERARRMHYRGGATLVALVMEEESGHVAFAWAGDSVGILVREGTVAFRTSIHSVSSDSELRRLQDHEPRYKYQIDDGYLCSLNKYRGCVMPTRGIGDIDMEPAGFLSVPETSNLMSMGPGDLVLMASDGLWDVLPEVEVLEKLSKAGDWKRNILASEALAKAAVSRWLKEYGRASEADDISIVLFQPEVGQPAARTEL
ncbi:unnamed protein product [Durusdinium trenchii]|uniref:PPM-type phosphatase domain-containing protein n=1 Tax=Durusdinium trenchii TaxID=1381693 RepID=A0ABP0SZI0_9DINO